jgi:hypothetical protein
MECEFLQGRSHGPTAEVMTIHLVGCSRMPYRGDVMASLRQRGQRLGLVSRLRSRKTNAQSRHSDGSSRNVRALSRARVFTICVK